MVAKIRPPVLSAAVFVKGAFSLTPGDQPKPVEEPELPSGDRYVDDDPAKELLYSTDFVPFKPRCDIIVVASAHAPDGQAVPSFSAAIAIGNFQKRVDVIGPRRWSRGGPQGRADPVARVPLSYANAFGGPGYARNPLGLGIESDELPYLELPGSRIYGREDRPAPAGFGALGAGWDQRAKLVGTYDGDYVNTRWPWFPEDFDWGYFNAAPADQQIAGYLRGDEELAFSNLHPQHPVYRTRLPGLCARLFVTLRKPEQPDEFAEVPVRLDTLWADMTAEKLVLVWRGDLEILTPLMREVVELFATTEPVGAPPRTLDEYRMEKEERVRVLQAEDEDVSDQSDLQDAAEDAAVEREFAESGRKMAEAEAGVAKLEADAEAHLAQAEQQLTAVGVGPNVFISDPGITFVQILAAAEEAHAAKLIGSPDGDTKVGPLDLSEFREMEQEFAARDQPANTRVSVAAVAEAKGSLAGQSFFELDLSGLDLRGLDLSGSDFTGAKLVGTNLAGANLSKSDLSGVDMSNADLTEAILDQADLTGCRVAGTKLTNVSASYATLSKLDLTGADLSGVHGRGADFTESTLAGARFVGAAIPGADFTACVLERADFTRADLPAAQFEGVKALGIVFREANVTGLHAGDGADFRNGQFQRATGKRAVFERSLLDGADFSRAVLTGAQFGEASAIGATFDRAELGSAEFNDAVLHHAKLTNANLLRAGFDRADLTDASLAGSNLYEAGFWETQLDNVDFTKANLKGTTLA